MRATIVLLSLLVLGGTSPRVGYAQSTPVTVTTDTLTYCDALSRRLPASLSAAVTRLREEGETMCATGHVRGGIMQLRRALLLARSEGDAAP